MAHVAFVCNPGDRLDPAARSSVPIVIASLAREVARSGHDVSILGPDAAKASSDPTLAGIQLVNVSAGSRVVARLDQFLSGYVAAQNPFSTSDRCYARYRARVVGALSMLRPDIVHVSTYGQYLPEIAAALPGARRVLHLHDELWGHLPPDYVQARLGLAAHVLCVNTHIRDTLLSRDPAAHARVSVLHNAVDPELFRAGPAQGQPGRRLVYVGRLSPEKGLHVLGAAVGRLHQRFPDLVVDVVGSAGLIPYDWLRWIAADDAACRSLLPWYGTGPIDAIRRQIFDRGQSYVRDSIAAAGAGHTAFRLHDFVPHADLYAYYRTAAAVVCPSVCDEIPLSAYEGMAIGRPAVVSCDLSRDGPVAHGETALVVPRADPLRLADALAELLASPARAASMGAAARRAVLSNHTWSNAGQRLLAVYERLLAPGH